MDSWSRYCLFTLVIFVLPSFGAVGCFTVSPSPDFTNYRADLHKEPGETSVSVTAADRRRLVLGLPVASHVGGSLDIGHQMSSTVQLGVTGNMMVHSGESAHTTHNKDENDEWTTNEPKFYGTARGYARLSALPIMDVVLGVGGGYAETGLTFGTVDTGVVLGPQKTLFGGGLLKPYLGATVGASIPFDKGEPLIREPNHPLTEDQFATNSIYYGAFTGLGIKITEHSQLYVGTHASIADPADPNPSRTIGHSESDDSVQNYKQEHGEITTTLGFEKAF